jgi:sialic acid synthase SpsE
MNIGSKEVGPNQPTYFIADISANHDGRLQRAKDLIYMAKEAGADAAKFQHFRADKIVSKYGFDRMQKTAHQAGWKEDVYTAFQKYSLPWEWTPVLADYCKEVGIEFLSTPYDLEAVDHLDPYVSAFKIGSGDITYHDLIQHVVSKGKPILLAIGASAWWELTWIAATLPAYRTCVMQCNTNYTGSVDNYQNLNLRVIPWIRSKGFLPGLSDHTDSIVPVVGAVTLGARIIERHFTDDRSRTGPDHPFSQTPAMWKSMLGAVRLLESALGSGEKKVEANETETVILQRRCLRATRDLHPGELITSDMFEALRPAPPDSLPPYRLASVLGRVLKNGVTAGDHLREGSIL